MADKVDKEKIVKARIHHGSNSLDLTIPSTIVAESGIKEGDLFKVVSKKNSQKIVLEYERIYQSGN